MRLTKEAQAAALNKVLRRPDLLALDTAAMARAIGVGDKAAATVRQKVRAQIQEQYGDAGLEYIDQLAELESVRTKVRAANFRHVHNGVGIVDKIKALTPVIEAGDSGYTYTGIGSAYGVTKQFVLILRRYLSKMEELEARLAQLPTVTSLLDDPVHSG